MLTLLAYADYARRPGVLRYLWVVLAYVLGLMAKPMLVTVSAGAVAAGLLAAGKTGCLAAVLAGKAPAAGLGGGVLRGNHPSPTGGHRRRGRHISVLLAAR